LSSFLYFLTALLGTELLPLEPQEDDDDDEGSYCNICMESWTNSGSHRISSLRCGHFFGHACIERWLRGNAGNGSCPTCNEKATKKDVRVHYVARLKAIDTSEKDRALTDLNKARMDFRRLELERNTLKVQLKMQSDQIEGLQRQLKGQKSTSGGMMMANAAVPGANLNTVPMLFILVALRVFVQTFDLMLSGRVRSGFDWRRPATGVHAASRADQAQR
jgi:cell division protein FtsL